MGCLDWVFLGRVTYPLGLRLQAEHARRVSQGADPCLFMMEHPPTVTLGRQANPVHLRFTSEGYREHGIEVFRVDRGGDVTFHGPGQLVGYPVASLRELRRSVPDWVRGHAESLADCLAGLGIRSRWSELHPGLWVGRSKIAALGFHISRGVSTHGFALNVQPDLSYFDTIVPCGLKGFGVTSVAELTGRVRPLSEIAARIAAVEARTFGWDLGQERDADELLGAYADAQSLAALS